MSQKESEWESKYMEEFSFMDPNLGNAILSQVDKIQIRDFISKVISEAVDKREKEIAEEVEKKVKTDFTNAWKVMVTKKENHHEKCSWRVAGMLCDCAGQDVFIETTKLFRDSVLKIINHK